MATKKKTKVSVRTVTKQTYEVRFSREQFYEIMEAKAASILSDLGHEVQDAQQKVSVNGVGYHGEPDVDVEEVVVTTELTFVDEGN